MLDKDVKYTVSQRKECNFGGFRVLIADDFRFMNDLLSGMLREVGVGSIISCEGAIEAQNYLKDAAKNPSAATHVDLALIDWLMPGMDGVELIKWIRSSKSEELKLMPIILVSAYTSRKVVEAARDSGANEALVKPISADRLISRIVHMINNQRPFVKAPEFFGPDRRRQIQDFDGDEKRKMETQFVKVNRENG